MLLPGLPWMSLELPLGTGAVAPSTVIVTPVPVTPVTLTPPPAVVVTVPEVLGGNSTVAVPAVIVMEPLVMSSTVMLPQVMVTEASGRSQRRMPASTS